MTLARAIEGPTLGSIVPSAGEEEMNKIHFLPFRKSQPGKEADM